MDSDRQGRDAGREPAPEGKRAYEKPELQAIELAAEEVLIAGCKATSYGANRLGAPCITLTCSTIGS